MQKANRLSEAIENILIGDFQRLVLAAVADLGGNAYGFEIRKHVESSMGKPVHQPQIYSALVRLEALKLIASAHDPEPPAGRVGRPRRLYHLTASGLPRAVALAKRTTTRMQKAEGQCVPLTTARRPLSGG